jgi:hypothetical protein
VCFLEVLELESEHYRNCEDEANHKERHQGSFGWSLWLNDAGEVPLGSQFALRLILRHPQGHPLSHIINIYHFQPSPPNKSNALLLNHSFQHLHFLLELLAARVLVHFANMLARPKLPNPIDLIVVEPRTHVVEIVVAWNFVHTGTGQLHQGVEHGYVVGNREEVLLLVQKGCLVYASEQFLPEGPQL